MSIKTLISQKLRFNRHQSSISGLHVTLVAGLVAFGVGALWRRHPRAPLVLATPRAAALAGTVGALLYTLLAGAGVPALRTLTMVAVASLAVVAGRATRVSRVLAAALLAVLLLDPWAVLAPGFWLSYGIPKSVTVPVWNGYALGRRWHRIAFGSSSAKWLFWGRCHCYKCEY